MQLIGKLGLETSKYKKINKSNDTFLSPAKTSICICAIASLQNRNDAMTKQQIDFILLNACNYF